jgi:hypothetical protein
VAGGLWDRLFGAMGPRMVPPGCALGIMPCDWVHTFFVRRPLDLAYCDREGRVLRVEAARQPWGVGPRVRGARTVWETAAGGLADALSPGDVLAVECGSEG